LGLVLVGAVVLAYQPAWTAGFIWDDDEYVTNNPLLSAPDGLWRIWFSTDSPSQYFPLVYSTFRLEYALWGLNSTGYHWVNILLHAINALLVWRLLSRLTLPGAWFGAALFALHPLQVESVAWITELKNVQSLFFFLLALLSWIEFTERPKPWGWYGLALVFHALALLSKTTACTLPAALILILWLKHKPIDTRRWLQVVPFVLLSLAMGLLTVWWERHHQGTGAVAFSYGPLDRVLIASRALCFYLGKFLWPVDLTFSYPLWKIDAAAPLAYAWLAGLGLLVGALFPLRKRFGRGPETASVWVAAMLSPLLGFIMLYTFKYTFVADHYVYVALLGPTALVAAGVFSLRSPVLRFGLAAVMLTADVTETFRQSHMYRDRETLWRTTIARNPASHIGHNNLSVALLANGQAEDALLHAQLALALNPPQSDRALAHINQGNALLQLGRIDESIFQLQKAVETQPDLADAHNNLGSAWRRKGDLDAAIACFQKAIALAPAHTNAHYNLGNAYFDQGALDEAVRHYQASLASNPNEPDTHTNLASTFLRQGRSGEAIAHFQTALQLAPTSIQSHSNLAYALLQASRPDEAAAVLERALKLLEKEPNSALKETLRAQLAACREYKR
jgi:tetratricopeptide (TPR) repeat protein